MTSPIIWAVVPAAGVGSRMNSQIPKQYLSLGRNTVSEITLNKIAQLPDLAGIVVAIGEEDDYWTEQTLPKGCRIDTVTGGKDRADSVLNALSYLSKQHSKDQEVWVLVHDMARPCVELDDVLNLVETCVKAKQGGILAVPVVDTLKKQAQEQVVIKSTQPREGLWQAQTPQFFPLFELQNALIKANEKHLQVTDEASAMEQVLGQQPLLIKGRRHNIKITEPEDLLLAKLYLENELT